MAEAVLELDISPALDALADISSVFDSIADDFSATLSGSITDTVLPQIEEIGAAFGGIAADAGDAFSDVFSGIDTTSLEGANEDVESLDSGLEDLANTTEKTQAGFDVTTSAVQGLQAATGLLEGSSRGLLATVAPGAALFAGTAAAIGGVVESADRMELSFERMKFVFGDQAPVVFDQKLQGLNLSLGELNKQAGGSNTALRLAISTFGQTAVSAGASREEAAKVSQTMGELAGVVTTLNPTLGTADQNFSVLSKGLGGSARILQRYGITIDATEQKQLALAIAHDHGRDAVNLFDKQVAGSTLALQALNDQATANGTTLSEELGKGLDSSTIKFRKFKQDVSTALTEIGAPLIKPVLALTEQLTPVLVKLITVVGKFAAAVLPAFMPIAQAIADVVDAISPLLTAIGDIPPEFGKVVAAFVLLRSVGGPLGNLLEGIGGRFSALGTVASTAGDVMEGRFGGALSRVGSASERLGGFLQQNSQHLLTAAAAGLVASQSWDGIGHNMEDTIIGVGSLTVAGQQLGSMFGPLGGIIGAAAGFLVGFAKDAFSASSATQDFKDAINSISDSIGGLQGKKASIAWLKTEYGDTFRNAQMSTKDLDGELDYLGDHLEGLARKSPAQAKQALDGLKDMRTRGGDVLFTADAIGVLGERLLHGADKYRQHAQAGKDEAGVNQAVASSVGSVTDALNGQSKAIDDAASSMASAVTSGLPGLSGAFAEAQNAAQNFGVALTPESLLGGLRDSLASALEWTSNLRTIFAAGFTDLGVFLQQEGAQAGGGVTKAVADQLRAGQPEIAQQLNDTAAAVNVAGQVGAGYAKTQAAAVVTNSAAEYAKLAPTLGAYMGLTADEITNASPQLQSAATVAARFGVHLPFAAGVSEVPAAAGAAMAGATGQVAGAQGELSGAAQGTGTGTAAAFTTGVGGMNTGTSAALDGVRGLLIGGLLLAPIAMAAGEGIGAAFSSGIAVGIAENSGAVTSAASDVVGKAEAAARAKAESKSPSRLFARLGDDLAAGVALGVERTTPYVEGTMHSLVTKSVGVGVAHPGAHIGRPQSGGGLSSNGVTNMTNNFHGVKDGKDAIDELSWKLRTTGR